MTDESSRLAPFEPATLELVDGFEQELRAERNCSPNTIRAYRIDLEDFLRWCRRLDEDPLAVDHRGFRHYLADLDAAQYARRTVNRRLSTLRMFFGWLVQSGRLPQDPTAVVVSPHQPASLPHRIRPEDLDKLLTANDQSTVEGLRNQALLELMYATGARVGEVANLHVRDVDFPGRQVRLLGKGSKQRIVPLHPLALESIIQYLSGSRPHLLKADKEETALFLSTRGNPMSADALRKVFKECCVFAGIDTHYSPHDMRHTFATDLVENGADLRSVQELLGHASLSTTQIYTHLSIAHLKDVHRRTYPRA
jgi:integrase/recombinase XerD